MGAVAFGCVLPPFGGLWRDIGRLLHRAVERGGNDWAEVVAQLDDGRAQLWLGLEDGEPVVAGVSRLDGDTLEIWLVGGTVLSGFIPNLETVVEAATQAGARRGTITGRKGWQRVLRPYGWQPLGDNLVKEWAA